VEESTAVFDASGRPQVVTARRCADALLLRAKSAAVESRANLAGCADRAGPDFTES